VNRKGGVQKVIEKSRKKLQCHIDGEAQHCTTLKLGIKEVDEEQISTAKEADISRVSPWS